MRGVHVGFDNIEDDQIRTGTRRRSAMRSMKGSRRTRRGWKNHLFFPLVYRSSSSFLMVFFESSLCDGSLKVSVETVPLRLSSSTVYRVGKRWE
jgi:hypothetical protein